MGRFACIRRVQHGDASYASWKFASPQDGKLFDREVAGTLSFDSNDAIVDAGLAGDGLVQLHTYMAEPYLKSGQLVQVLTEYATDGAAHLSAVPLKPSPYPQGASLHRFHRKHLNRLRRAWNHQGHARQGYPARGVETGSMSISDRMSVEQIVIELETPGDSRSLFRLRLDKKVVGENLTAAQAHLLVGEILDRITLPRPFARD